jgi:glycosyltransferase involved in cell wall biosynthesis
MIGTRLSVVIPTPGKGRPLERTLRSVNHQRQPGDEVIVVHDAVDGVDPEVKSLCAAYGCRYLECDFGRHSWGHLEICAGMAAAEGDWIVHNDDDDVATPDAFRAIRDRIAELAEPRPLLFQFMTPWREVLWAERQLALARIGGHCLVHPNDPVRIAPMTECYQGDYDMIRGTVDLWGGDEAIVWCENLIAWTRPTPAETEWLIPSYKRVRPVGNVLVEAG